MPPAKILRAYLLLVGLPLAVLVTVLKLGKTLSAPPLDALRQGAEATAAAAPMNLFTLVLQVAVESLYRVSSECFFAGSASHRLSAK
jgi:hypothetical protein